MRLFLLASVTLVLLSSCGKPYDDVPNGARFEERCPAFDPQYISTWMPYEMHETYYYVDSHGMKYTLTLDSQDFSEEYWFKSINSCVITGDVYAFADTADAFDIGLNVGYRMHSEDPGCPVLSINWQLGDTIIASSFGDTFTHIIGLIDTVKVGGTDHKHFHMSPLPPYPPNAKSYSVVEGIGCIKNMFFMSFPSEFENGQNIYCFSNNGFRPLIAPAIGFYFDNATSCALDIQPAQIQGNNTLIVYPQPAFSVVNIQLPVIIQNGAIQIYDQLGRTLSGDRVHNTSSIKVNRPITPGLYYYRITDNATGRIWQGKVVFE